MTRGTIVLEGRADHAGTTPMADRSDALAASAECILAVERIAGQATEHLVGTVGELQVRPGAANVVPGTCRFSIELRSTRDDVRRSAFDGVLAAVEVAGRRRGVRWKLEVADEIPGTALAERVIDAFAAACLRLGLEAPRIVSGAGHDAQNVMAAGVPTGMIFIRSTGGSHNPGEAATAEDAAAGTRAMVFALDALFRSQ